MNHPIAAQPHDIQDACTAALSSHKAYAFLLDLQLSMQEGHPNHDAVRDTLALVRTGWMDEVGTVIRLGATTHAELLLKAAVMSRLIERDETDAVLGGPALALAASLADDILARP